MYLPLSKLFKSRKLYFPYTEILYVKKEPDGFPPICKCSKLCENVPAQKGPVKLNQAGENGSFIFTVCVKSVPRYHFKFPYVILQMAVKVFSKPTSENGDTGHFNL